MISKEIRLETFTPEGLQFHPAGHHLHVSKLFQGGEDSTLSFELDRDPRVNYRDIAYDNEVVLRRGLNPVWRGAMRNITQGEESLTIGAVGNWIYLDDYNFDSIGRMWCENRYAKWKPTVGIPGVTWRLERFEYDQRDRLYMAPRRNENFGNAPWVVGGFSYELDYDEIKRVSFDFDITLAANWRVILRSWDISWGAPNDEWLYTTVGAATGVVDVTLTNARPRLAFFIVYNAATARFAGETGDIYFIIKNLRLWGQTTESNSVIRVADRVVEQVSPTTPLSTDQDECWRNLQPARDIFTDPNGTLLANHRPNIDAERGGWTIDVGGFDIQSNGANNTANASRAYIDAGMSDGVVCCDVTTPASGSWQIGIIFRRVDTNNWWAWRMTDLGDLQLRRLVGGVGVTVWSSVVGIQNSMTYHLMVKLRGDEIRCYLGGILRTTQNDSNHQTATRHGLFSASLTGMRWDNFEVFQALPLWPLFYEESESCYEALRDAASFGDWEYRALGWGVETGGDRAFLRMADRSSVRYVIPAQYCRQLSVRGEAQRDFYTSGWAKYYDEEGMERFTAKYYAHVTNTGPEVNTTSTGNDLASTVYGVSRDHLFDFGRVDEGLAVEYLQRALYEQGHPKVQATIQVFGPVKDLHRGGALIEPIEMEMGYLVQIPRFRASEAEGTAGSDLRDYDTTVMMVGLEVDLETGIARIIPEGAQEDLTRMIKATRAIVERDEVELTRKRERVVGG